MSIELKQAAQQALDAFEAFGEADDFATLFTLTQKMNALRTAIQQAEAKTDEMGPLFVKGALSGIVDAQVRDLWPTKSATHPAAVPMTCHCQTCRPITITDMRMVLCPKCGNKRCPHANDHHNACTGSNEPGQPGSAYPDHHGITTQAKKGDA
jgi:hypothetical protein